MNAKATTTESPGTPLDDTIIDRYSALDEALREARTGVLGVGRFDSCEERDRLIADLEAAGATAVRENTYALGFEGRTYEVEVALIVA